MISCFSFGGYCTGDNYKDIRPIDIFVLNTITYRWTSVQKPKVGSVEAETWPFQRYGHTVSAHQGKVYIFYKNRFTRFDNWNTQSNFCLFIY